MSWYRQIKILYTISSSTFTFIIFESLLNGLLGGRVGYELFLLTLFSAFFMTFILGKTSKPVISAAAAFIISVAILFFIQDKTNFLFSSSYICFILFITYINEQQDVNYEEYKRRAKKALTILVVLGFICTAAALNTQQLLLKFYLIFLISISILMREARNYYYGLKNNKSFITNISIAALIIFFSLDLVFNRILILLSFLGNIIYKGLEWLTELLAILINKPLQIVMNYLKSTFSNKLNSINNIKVNQYNQQPKNYDAVNLASNAVWNIWLSNIIKVILLIAVIYIVYKFLTRLKARKMRNSMETILEREKLSKDKNYNTYSIKRALKNIFKAGDLREQIINIYKKFQQKTNEKGIYRKHMTAKQLENITKTYIEKPEGISNLTDIYNEAKFSSHRLSKEKLEAMKESFTKVKKQFK